MVGDVNQPDEVRRKVQQYSRNGIMPALWLQVLINLCAVTTEKRAELRNSAVQTIQRIFENYADRLSPETWMLCLRIVLFAMVESNLGVHTSIRSNPQAQADEVAAWNETTKTVLSSVSILLITYMENIEHAPGFGNAWSDLLNYFQQYFHCGSHALGSSVFSTITSVLSRVGNPQLLGSLPLNKTASVWKEYFDHRKTWQTKSEGNQEAFVAYADAFKAIYKLSPKTMESDLPSMLSNLEACIVDSDEVAYSSDVDHMTPLQTQVIECFSTIETHSAGLPSYLIQMLSRLTVLPYDSIKANPERRGPTFVALSKAAMDLLQVVTTRHISDKDIYVSGAFHSALESLAKPIEQKYIWQREGKPPTIWQKATTTALQILQPGLLILGSNETKSDTAKEIWTQVVRIASGITGARISMTNLPSSVEKDEAFDTEAFLALRNIITIPLGSTIIPDSLRRSYARHLFETSIIHQPAPGEIPNLTKAPLEDLYKIRFGHTSNPEPILRTGMALVCFSELVSLVSVHDSSKERTKLAQAAAPYLILRATLPLRAYIADHPLRGRMPAPESQQRELLFTLKALKDLKSEPQAIPDAPGVTSIHKKHLHRLYPLLVRAIKVARNDPEVFGYLVALTEIVGDEFGLQDD